MKKINLMQMEKISGGVSDYWGSLLCGATTALMLTGGEPLAVFTGIGCYAYVMSKS
jgi:hypothetical protein